MQIYKTDIRSTFNVSHRQFRRDEKAEMGLLVCDPRVQFQSIVGFGGAFTESGAYTFAQMPPELQDDVIRLYFDNDPMHPEAGGNAYNLCRTHIQSCDFSLGNYAYVDEGDDDLSSFSIDRDRELLLPFIQCGLTMNPQLQLIAAPWSPPAFMKTNGSMNHGGRLKREYYPQWAKMIAMYLRAYADEGVSITRLTAQNEPNAFQTWDSCFYDARDEAEFVTKHLKPALDDAGFGDVKILMWDHNKDMLNQRVGDVLSEVEAMGSENPFSGVAFHWYAGDHFAQVQEVASQHPSFELLATEGCVEYLLNDFMHIASKRTRQLRHAERYAHDMIGDLRSGAQGWIDWNLLLDEQGGPNHVHNYCEAPLMYHRKRQSLLVNRSYHYMGHITRFVRPGARRFLTSQYTHQFESVGFLNPDGQRVLVVLNATDQDAFFDLAERPFACRLDLDAHSIMTITWEAGEVKDFRGALEDTDRG